ncbi:hypothetical protein BGX27_006231, partial [Mortierella sp. AM989]
MREQQYQQFRLTDIIEEVCVKTSLTPASNSNSSNYVSLEDIRDVFPEAMRFKLNGHPIPFLTEPDGTRILPLRIAFYRDKILDVITGAPQPSNQISQDLLLSLSSPVQSFNSSHIARNPEQADMIKCDHALNQSTLEKHMIEVMSMQRQITDLLLEAKDKDDKMLSLQMEAKDKDDKMLSLQLEAKDKDDKMFALQMEAKNKDDKMLSLQLEAKEKDEAIANLQNQAPDRLAILQRHAQAILIQNFELH